MLLFARGSCTLPEGLFLPYQTPTALCLCFHFTLNWVKKTLLCFLPLDKLHSGTIMHRSESWTFMMTEVTVSSKLWIESHGWRLEIFAFFKSFNYKKNAKLKEMIEFRYLLYSRKFSDENSSCTQVWHNHWVFCCCYVQCVSPIMSWSIYLRPLSLVYQRQVHQIWETQNLKSKFCVLVYM